MKAVVGNIIPRVSVKRNRQEGVINYDDDNLYPQRVDILIRSSGTAFQSIGTYAKFIEGKGFKDETFYRSKVNEKGLTADKLLLFVCKSISAFRGCVLHVNYNANYQITEVHSIPFPYVRFTDPGDEYAKITAVSIYDDWSRQIRARIDKSRIDIIDLYDPSPEVIEAQVSKAGGWDKYKGQVLYFSLDGIQYPASIIDPIIRDVQVDAGTQAFRHRNVMNNFMPSAILMTDKAESDTEANEFAESLKDFQGSEEAFKILWLEKSRPDQTIDLKTFDISNQDKLFELTTRTAKDSIIECVGVPPILMGVQVSGKLGSSNEIREATDFYNSMTEPERRVVENIFKEIFSRFAENINPSGDYSIVPRDAAVSVAAPSQEYLSYLTRNEVRTALKYPELAETKADKQILAEQLGVGGTTALVGVVSNPALTSEQKVSTLVVVFGITPEQARQIVYGGGNG